jgi:ribosomal protein L7/L12
MNTEIELPADVIAEIEANRKIAAIKLLRAHKGIGLKEAKELVDDYIAMHPSTSLHQAAKTDTGIGRILILILGVGVIYGLYKYFV